MVNASSNVSTQGYVTMAYGKNKFFEMAANLALSLRLNDPRRPVSLLHKPSEAVPSHIQPLFDQCIPFHQVDRFPGVTVKLNVFDPTPYAEAFWIDADCLLMKMDMDRHWQKFGHSDFTVAGNVVRSGHAYGLDVSNMLAASRIDYTIDANWGIFHFKKNAGGQRVFEIAQKLCDERSPAMLELRPRRGDGLSDQPFFAAAMARCGLRPVSYTPEEGTIMATTYQSRRIDFDFEQQRSALQKPIGFRVLNRFWAKGWVSHSTTFAHFIELRPLPTYQRLSNWLREQFGFPHFDFS